MAVESTAIREIKVYGKFRLLALVAFKTRMQY